VTLVRPRAGLPTTADSFIGRGRDLSELAAALHTSRLVVLTGPSGVGKTRLSSELAARVAGDYSDGAHFVDLAAITDPDLVPQTVASALSIWERPGQNPLDTLVSSLQQQHLLLIIDNCEHVLQACAVLVDTLLSTCAQLTVLATSQSILGIGGERVWPVSPLSVPETAAPGADLAESESVSLFCARAAAISPGFSATGEALAAVADICRQLDGIPLAIELAAARIAVLSPAQLAARMNERFAILTGGSRAVMPRHQTLEMALEWSHNLLSTSEQVLLRRLSVFAGGCTLEAVERVCGDEANPQVLDPLAGLVAKSLVLADTAGTQARYRTLETIRVYAAQRLADAGEEPRIRARHADWCVALAEEAEPELTGPDQVAWLEHLDVEQDNLRAGLGWALREGQAVESLRLAGSLTLYWRIRGHFREGADRLASALGIAADQPPALRARPLWGLGFMMLMLDDAEATHKALDESLALSEQIGDLRGQARALLLLGNWQSAPGDPASALVLLEQSARLAREAGDTWCLAHALALSGRTHLDHGREANARPRLEECLEVARRARDDQSLRIGIAILGELTLGQGEYDRAEKLLTEGLAIGHRLGEPYAVSFMTAALGELAAGRGDYLRARELLLVALRIDREGGATRPAASTLTRLGSVALATGDHAEADALFKEAAAILAEVGMSSAENLLGRGEAAACRGDLVTAKALIDEALEAARARGNSRSLATVCGSMGRLLRALDDSQRAFPLQREALELSRDGNYVPHAVHALEDLGGLAVDMNVADRAARLLGAAHAVREQRGYARPPVLQPVHDADLTNVRKTLGAELFAEAWAEGTALPLGEAVTYALKGWGPRVRGTSGWASLSRAERDVVNLVAEGLTNVEIGARLFISPRTVETHLTHVFSKLDLSSRRELGREALRRKRLQ